MTSKAFEFLSAAGWLGDLRFALRSFIRTPLVSLTAVLSLALGIGAATALFGIVDTVLLRPLPYASPERLLVIDLENARQNLKTPMSARLIRDWQRETTALDEFAFYVTASFTLTGDPRPERVAGVRASASFFSVLGAKPLLGRAFLPDDDQPGRGDVIVISHDLWQSRYGGDQAAIGKKVLVNDQPVTIIGVMPRRFNFPSNAEAPMYWNRIDRTDVWKPLALSAPEMDNPVVWTYSAIGRLKSGVELEQARFQLAPAFDEILNTVLKGAPPGWGVSVRFLSDKVSGEFRGIALLLFAGSLLLLVIACANVASLLLVRGSRRQGELAVRIALGIGHRSLVRMLVAESFVLGGLGGIAGIAFAWCLLSVLVSSVPPTLLPRLNEVSINPSVALFCMALSLLSSLSFGLVPVTLFMRTSIGNALRSGPRDISGGLGRRVRRAFIVCEVAVTLVLVTTTVLLVRSFANLVNVPTGFDMKQIMTMRLFLTGSKYREPRTRALRVREIIDRYGPLPGIGAIGGIDELPLTGEGRAASGIVVEGQPREDMHKLPVAEFFGITPDYLRAMGISLKQGRAFREGDSMGGQPVAIVSETAARKFWPGSSNVIGKRLKFGDSSWIEVVGVAGDVRASSLTAPSKPQIYRPYYQDPRGQITLVVRSDIEPSIIVPMMRAAVWRSDKDLTIGHVSPMAEVHSSSLSRERLQTYVCGTFAASALLLAAIGIYGVVAYSAGLRVREVGVRITLGASGRSIIVLMMKEMALLLMSGIMIGIAINVAIARLMRAFVYGIAATDLPSLVLGVGILTGVALLAAWIPAQRAGGTDPISALRQD